MLMNGERQEAKTGSCNDAKAGEIRPAGRRSRATTLGRLCPLRCLVLVLMAGVHSPAMAQTGAGDTPAGAADLLEYTFELAAPPVDGDIVPNVLDPTGWLDGVVGGNPGLVGNYVDDLVAFTPIM